MCTVTYLPRPQSDFLLTHNRDEKASRGIAQWPTVLNFSNQAVLCPVDADAGGTWIACSHHFTLCLLNGGFEKHISTPPYRHSRGKVIIDFYQYNSVAQFLSLYDTRQLEPFTLIIIEHEMKVINQCVFDGHAWHHTILDEKQAHIWSSTTLYTKDTILRRKNQFAVFLKQEQIEKEDIIAFHTNQHPLTQHQAILIPQHGELRTVSLTAIVKSDRIAMSYYDFIQLNHMEIVL